MKILHIGKYYPPFFGGIENVNYDLVEGMHDKGCKVDVLVINHDNKLHQEKKGYSVMRKKMQWNIASQPISFAYLHEILAQSKMYDIVHVHLPNPLATLPLLFLKLKKTKIVLHWHCDIVEQKLMYFFYAPFEYFILKKADRVITTSENYARNSPSLKKFASKTKVVPIGIDSLKVLQKSQQLDNIIRNNHGKKIIFSLGRLVRYKGFRYLIEAARDISDDAIIVIGGVGPLEKALKDSIVQYKLEKKVFLVGRISNEELGYYFQKCSIYCFPSITRNEAFGVSQLEAMSFGKPIISTNILGSGVSWVNMHMESGIVVPPKDSSALSKSINELMCNEVLFEKLSKGSRERYDAKFTKNNMVESFLKIYQELQLN